MNKIEEFRVIISKEENLFAVDVELENGEILRGHGSNKHDVYRSMSGLLIEREKMKDGK